MLKHPSHRLVAASLLLGALSLGFAGCERHGAQQMQMPPRPPAQVTAAPAVTRDVPVYLDEIGKTVAVESVSIVPQVGGKIIAAHITDGAMVKKGDLLFEIDPRPFEAAVASAQASVAQGKADFALAQTELKRVESLLGTNAVSALEVDQKRSAVTVAEARVAAAEAAVQTAKLNLEYSKIYSPIDGRAGARLVDPGNIAKANDVPLLTLQRLDPIYAEFTVTENDLGTVRKYMTAHGLDPVHSSEANLKVFVDVPGDSTRLLSALTATPLSTQPTTNRATAREGLLTFMDNSVQSNTGTIRLRATLPNPDRYFWPGQFVNVRLVLTTRKDAILVPVQAQQIGQQGPFVYVVKPDSTAEIRPITPGQRQGDQLVVERGLQPGEMVIIKGQMSVTPNGKVLVTNGQPPSNNQPGSGHSVSLNQAK